MTSPNLNFHHVLPIDLATRALEDLYARRDAVDNLIRSLEEYERSGRQNRRRATVRVR